MSKKRREHSAAFKSKVALMAIKEEMTQSQIVSKFQVHMTQIHQWKRHALLAIQECFTKKIDRDRREQEELLSNLYEQIGRLQTELTWIKKKSGFDD